MHTQVAAYYSISDESVVADKDLAISVAGDKRRIYGAEGAVDYLTPDIDRSAGANFNVLETEPEVSDTWWKYDVKTTSPPKATAYIGQAPDPRSLHMQNTTSFDTGDAQGYKVDGYTIVDLLGSYQLPMGALSFSTENLFDHDYTTVWRQCAPLYYSPGYGPASLYDCRGRGRTLGLDYFVLF